MKLPAFQFYPGDWLKDTRHLSLAAKGALIDIMCAAHDSSNRGVVRTNLMQLARYLGAQVDQARSVVSELTDVDNPTGKAVLDRENLAGSGEAEGRAEGGGGGGVMEGFSLTSRRMVKDESLRQVRAQAGSKGAEFGKLGGRPVKESGEITAKQTANKPLGEGQSNPPSSSNSASPSEHSPLKSPGAQRPAVAVNGQRRGGGGLESKIRKMRQDAGLA